MDDCLCFQMPLGNGIWGDVNKGHVCDRWKEQTTLEDIYKLFNYRKADSPRVPTLGSPLPTQKNLEETGLLQ